VGDQDRGAGLLTRIGIFCRREVNTVKSKAHIVVLSLIIIGTFAFIGCSDRGDTQAEQQEARTDMDHMASRSSGSHTQMKDPVCGMTVNTSSQHKAAHEGRTYYFCSSGCREKFVENPQKYLAQ
jgi:YHS domain-containing protein